MMVTLEQAKTAMEIVAAVSKFCDQNHISELSKFINRNFRKKIKVLVLGTSGNGKTSFLNSLLGGSIIEPNRTMRNTPFKMELPDGRIVEFIDTPGHSTYDVERDLALSLISKNQITGIVNVVSYGYAISSDIPLSEVFKTPSSASVDNNEVRPEYLENNRKRELNHLDEVVGRISINDRPKWILTVINKVDVWSENQELVQSYYEKGEYAKHLTGLEKVCRMFVTPYCSVIAPFGKRKMSIAIGEEEKNQYYQSLRNLILGLLLQDGK